MTLIHQTKSLGRKLVHAMLRNEPLVFTLIAQILLRIPNLVEPYWYGDEAIYLTIGQGLRNGLVLYRDIIDHKTPVIYYLASVPSQFWFKFLLLIWTSISTVLFYVLALRLLRSKRAASISTILFAIATTLPWFEGNIANGELFVMGFILVGAVILTRLPIFHAFMEKKAEFTQHPIALIIAGVFFSLGVLTKVPAVFDIAAFFTIILFLLARHHNLATLKSSLMTCVWIGVGILIPIAVSILYFASQHALMDYYQFGLLYNFRYSSEVTLPFTQPILKFLYGTIGKFLIVVAGLVAMRVLSNKVKPAFQFIFMWSLLALFSTLLSSRPYPHYWMQTVPPLALLLGYLFSKAHRIERALVAVPITIFIATLFLFHVGLYPTVSYYQNFLKFATHQIDTQTYRGYFNDSLMRDTYHTAWYIKSTTTPEQHLFIWGNDPMLYALADRRPVGRYTVTFHIQDFNAFDDTMKALNSKMPPIIVVMNDEQGKFPEFRALLAQKYVQVEHLQTMTIYRRLVKPL
ncbi:MAG TPA: phospholipid carrier-dependent glycosyltransferase [Candidatus Saccharimonadia bacterium]|nr:phospholipid carrier-dependent glycosyltransferase [Candidatus Saccharimonadia bacterium]